MHQFVARDVRKRLAEHEAVCAAGPPPAAPDAAAAAAAARQPNGTAGEAATAKAVDEGEGSEPAILPWWLAPEHIPPAVSGG